MSPIPARGVGLCFLVVNEGDLRGVGEMGGSSAPVETILGESRSREIDAEGFDRYPAAFFNVVVDAKGDGGELARWCCRGGMN